MVETEIGSRTGMSDHRGGQTRAEGAMRLRPVERADDAKNGKDGKREDPKGQGARHLCHVITFAKSRSGSGRFRQKSDNQYYVK